MSGLYCCGQLYWKQTLFTFCTYHTHSSGGSSLAVYSPFTKQCHKYTHIINDILQMYKKKMFQVNHRIYCMLHGRHFGCLIEIIGLGLWFLTSFSTIFQLYRGQFYRFNIRSEMSIFFLKIRKLKTYRQSINKTESGWSKSRQLKLTWFQQTGIINTSKFKYLSVNGVYNKKKGFVTLSFLDSI